MHAVVVGAGIAGLACARALHRGGWDVEVHERAPGPPAGGWSLGMWPHAVAALHRLGLADLVRDGTAPVAGGELLRPDGRVLARVVPSEAVHLVSRPALLTALADGLPAGVVRWGSVVGSPADVALDADLVVAADGVGGVLRRSVVPSAPPPRSLGTVAVRGSAEGAFRGMAETWGRGRMFGATARLDGRTNVYACFRRTLAGPAELRDPTAALRRLYAGWHPGVTATIEALDPTTLDVRPLCDVAPLPRLVSGRTALVGDAAHAMAPHLGRGACEALVDAVALSGHLLAADPSSGGVAVALERYDRERRRPTSRVVRASRVLNALSTAQHLTGVRDVALAAAGRVAAWPPRPVGTGAAA